MRVGIRRLFPFPPADDMQGGENSSSYVLLEKVQSMAYNIMTVKKMWSRAHSAQVYNSAFDADKIIERVRDAISTANASQEVEETKVQYRLQNHSVSPNVCTATIVRSSWKNGEVNSKAKRFQPKKV
jgi:hypothetical protein